MARSRAWLLGAFVISCANSPSALRAMDAGLSSTSGSTSDGASAADASTPDTAGDSSSGSIDSDADTVDAAVATGSFVDSTAEADSSPGPSVQAAVTVMPGVALGQIGPGFAGLSYEKSHLIGGFFSANNAPLVALLRLLGPSILRIGGNSVDETMWQGGAEAGAPAGDAAAQASIAKSDVDGLATLVKAAGWSVIYGVNMKTSTPAIAADEASYAAADLASNLYGFEIGNEVDLYKSTLLSATWSYAIFDTQWRVFASAIRGGGPGAAAALTGPAAASNYEGYTVPFAADEASQIRLLTQHYYRANGMLATSTLDLLLKPDPGLVTMLEALSTAATKNAILDGYRCSECNSFYNGGASGVSDAFGTALWGIDFLFTNAEYGGSGVNFHGGGNGPGYTPIADANGAVVGVRPLYYGMLLFNLAGPGSMVEAQVDAAGLNFTAYAVGSTGGSTNIVLVNKDSTTTAHTTIHVGKTISMATVTRLEGPSLGATTGTTLGGAPVDVTGTWAPLPAASVSVSGDQAIVDVPPASAAMVHTD